MKYQHITIETDGGIGTMTLQRADRLNAFNGEMAGEMVHGMRKLLAQDALRVVVITGAGRGFCAGADLEYLRELFDSRDEKRGRKLLEAGRDLVMLIRKARVPVVASVNGPAAGGGANLALACDIRIASRSASFGQNFVKIGLHPDWGGLYFLPRLVGSAKALELMMRGDMIGAQEAHLLGLVNQVVADDQLRQATRELAQELADGPPLSFSLIKKGVYKGGDDELWGTLDYEIKAQLKCFHSKDAAEGLKATLEKRPPRFVGA